MNLEYEKISDNYDNDLLEIWSDEEVIKYTNIKSKCILEDTNKRIERFKEHDVFAVIHNKKAIGVIGCPCVNKDKKEFGIFYQFNKDVWGRGIATESVRWLVNYMKNKYINFTIYADVVSDNIASVKILNSFGFTWLIDNVDGFTRNNKKMTIKNYILIIEKSSLCEVIYNCEEELLQSEVRKDANKIADLISEDFVEFTSSGYVANYIKGEVFQGKDDNTELNWELKDFKMKELSNDYVLATYKVIKHNEADESKKYSLRSSIWHNIDGKWKMMFHQGTLTSKF